MDRLSGQAISDAVGAHGWRLVLGGLRTSVEVGSLARAAEVAGILAAVAGDGLRLDLRPDRVHVALHPPTAEPVTVQETDLAVRMTAALRAAGFTPSPTGLQAFEIAIDALDIAAVRPFWKAVFGYVDATGDPEAITDPRRLGPDVWFQRMDAPRPQRNRIHFDIWVSHDQAEARIAGAVAAGGRIVNDAEAPAFTVVADPEGNEACVCVWVGRG
jgi:4a-hydroxytetrahydrobiopterin dehydratase